MKKEQGYPFLVGKRNEINDEEMEIISGELPTDIGGFVYVVCQMGNVNSDGLPFPKYEPNGADNPDFQSPIMNGDGLVYKFDFSNKRKVRLSSNLMKPPSFYADKATGYNGEATKNSEFKSFHFKNLGISRLSFKLGSRNFLNTAFLPVHFKTDDKPSILVTGDVARPFKMNPKNLELDTPIGKTEDWTSSLPPGLKYPFALTETTAHPCWDPYTKEFFSFNYLKSSQSNMEESHISQFLFNRDPKISEKLKKIAQDYENHESEEQAIISIKKMMKEHQDSRGAIAKFFGKIWNTVKKVIGKISNFFSKEIDMSTADRVFLMRSTDGVHMQKWRLLDQFEKDIRINQCMHQTIITKNHIIFVDASFKFALELLFNNPFPDEPKLDEFIRKISSKTMLPFTDLWYIKRSEIDSSKDSLTAYKLDEPLPYECIHFGADYDDSNGITLYTIHNNSVCLAEWLRPYDKLHFTKEAVPDYLISYFAVCPLAVGRTGRFVIDPDKNTFSSKIILKEPGNLPPLKELKDKGIDSSIGANTWGLGLLVYKNQYSPTKMVDKIDTLYYISLGAIPETLSKFVLNLYKDYPWREMPLPAMLAYIEQTIPQCLFSLKAETMDIKDYWVFNKNEHLCSIQYVNSNDDEGIKDNGYILLTVKVGEKDNPTLKGNFTSELWLFKANAISDGPIFKAKHSKFIFASTLHSCWLEDDLPMVSGKKIYIKEDYTNYINTLFKHHPNKREKMLDFFEKYVFPNF